MSNRIGSGLIRSAHGAAAASGAVLVVETLPLDELRPLNAADTEAGLAVRKARGRPFQVGNTAASNRGPSLTRVMCDPNAPEERRRVQRKASNLKRKRESELSVQHGGHPVSTAVKTELVAWARCVAWAEHYDLMGDAKQAALLSEKASAHQMKAIGIAEREAKARPKANVSIRDRILGGAK